MATPASDPRRDELPSSWLWRVACGIDASPKRFALDAIGTQLADVDREIDDAAIERIAFLSGHTSQQLLRGTLRADVEPDIFDIRDRVQRLLLRYGDVVLNKRRGGRTKPMNQYCPVCLVGDDLYLARGWRFSLDVVCVKDGCFLLDSCSKCGGLLDPLTQTAPSPGFTCVECGTPFATAPSLRPDRTVLDQGSGLPPPQLVGVSRGAGARGVACLRVHPQAIIRRFAGHEPDEPRAPA